MINDGLPVWMSGRHFVTIVMDRTVNPIRVKEFVNMFIASGYDHDNAKSMVVLTQLGEDNLCPDHVPLQVAWASALRDNAKRIGLSEDIVLKDLESLGLPNVNVVVDGAHRHVAWVHIGINPELLDAFNKQRAIDKKPAWSPDIFFKTTQVRRD